MENEKDKNLLFQFLEEMYTDNQNSNLLKEIENKLLNKVEIMKLEHSYLNIDLEEIINYIYELCGETKYQYFIYGTLAGGLIEDLRLK